MLAQTPPTQCTLQMLSAGEPEADEPEADRVMAERLYESGGISCTPTFLFCFCFSSDLASGSAQYFEEETEDRAEYY